MKILKYFSFFLGDFISETNLNSILSSFTTSVQSLSKAIKDENVSSGITPNAGEVIGFVCDLLATLQTSNRLCWQVEEAQAVLIVLFSLDVSMTNNGKVLPSLQHFCSGDFYGLFFKCEFMWGPGLLNESTSMYVLNSK